MAPRPGPKRVRENDYSNVGRAGRRTGVVLPEKKRDEHGIEEITGLFSSPRKPSPPKVNGVDGASGNADFHNTTIEVSEDMVGMDSSGLEPTQVLSTRKSLRGTPLPPRSASPKKTGINGAARRSGTDFTPSKVPSQEPEDIENTSAEPRDSPVRPNGRAKRFNPEKTPLQDKSAANQTSTRTTRQGGKGTVNHASPSITPQGRMNAIVDDILDETGETTEDLKPSAGEDTRNGDDDISYDVNPMGDEEDQHALQTPNDATEETNHDPDEETYSLPNGRESWTEPGNATSPVEDGGHTQESLNDHSNEDKRTAAVTTPSKNPGRPPKRKSDTVNSGTSDVPSKKTKTGMSSKAKGKRPVYRDQSPVLPSIEQTPKVGQPAKSNSKSKRAPKPKDPNVQSRFGSEREKELQDVVERIKSRPGPPRSLFILKRETPSEDSATRTRSGRVSVKPLAYWKNERCVYGEGSPHNVGVGERFPMTSIKEIVRVEEQSVGEGGKKSRKGKTKGKRRRGTDGEEDETDLIDAENGEDANGEDANAEPWEIETGVFQGYCRDWDSEEQAAIDEAVETDIAYAASSISCREVKNATFRYAKLLSMPFFGAGIVELPPGATKKTKNSNKMHMCFFVLKGRVTATVAGNRFSVGEGGMWQVLRGNPYAIENELEAEAKLFFSQGCEPPVPVRTRTREAE